MKLSSRTPLRPAKTPRSRPVSAENMCVVTTKPSEPVQVFCRVRPLQSDGDLSCVRVKNSKTIALTPTDQILSNKQNAQREMQYIFKHVFEPGETQNDIFTSVAQPLVENLIRGRNSLLFTYGVTGSGKTFTMTGDNRHRGIMPRCLDVLFRTISNYQAKKYIFKPDRLNGFEILSEEDALIERQEEMNKRFIGGGSSARSRAPHYQAKDCDIEIASQASSDGPILSGLEEDNMFAVFVTYIEVYNNSVYDLLEEGNIQKTLQSKIIREDVNHNMFVHGVTEIEIKSVEEAIEVFQMGQKRKRMGHTILNAESSRSHSVFNIRLVQAPTDYQGENVIQDKRTITVSQLSLVDLAGSERSSRTKNTGVRLREAGNINNSLMTLRTCLEYLRENQTTANGVASKKIPYRDSKVTHLFKNFFDGEGQVSMVVCINPRAEDYDENSQVLKFAEMTQEVQIARPTPMKADFGLTPGRRKANKIFKMAVGNLHEMGHVEAKSLDTDVGLVYSLGPGFPDYKIDSPEAENAIQELMQCLIMRIEKRRVLNVDLEQRCNNFRSHLMQIEKDNIALRTELASLKAVYTQERERTFSLENKIRLQDSSIDMLNRKVSNRERQIDELTRKLHEQSNLLVQTEQEKEKQKKLFSSKLAVEKDKREREAKMKLREQREEMRGKIRERDEKLRLVSNIVKSDNVLNLVHSNSFDNMLDEDNENKVIETPIIQSARTIESAPIGAISSRTDASIQRQGRGIVAANIRHRRSRSAGEKWIEHRAPNPVPLGTIFQPYLKNRKSITKLTDKNLTSHKATKYCLVSQEADTDGDVETKLYKGNVIPTCGGGAQVVFDDVECLKQKSPIVSPERKRASNGCMGDMNSLNPMTAFSAQAPFSSMAPSSTAAITDIRSRCGVGIEGHASKRIRH